MIDLYDNFESFGATKLPGMTSLFRAACRRAAGLTVVSQALDEYVAQYYQPTGLRQVIGNGVRRDLFFPRERGEARAALGLPLSARLIGTAGAISAERGISDLFEAFLRLAEQDDELWLIYAGPHDATPSRYPHPRIIDLGVLTLDRVSTLLSALDVAVVCNRDSDFGRYCFPLKLYEIIACGVPLVAASLGDVREVLEPYPGSLYSPGDVSGLAAQIRRQLAQPTPAAEALAPSWRHWSNSLEGFIERVLASVQTQGPRQGRSRGC